MNSTFFSLRRARAKDRDSSFHIFSAPHRRRWICLPKNMLLMLRRYDKLRALNEEKKMELECNQKRQEI